MSRGTPPGSVQWRARDNIALFVRTLHLLDLDRLPDFPNITESTLRVSAKAPSNLQQRVKSVEWSLYRLYELYDPVDTPSRLHPYFPPSTPIQSLNLRTALYKVLTDLKKNGVLPRDIVLRKTMLDECKGERFEELLATFSMLVLRKTATTSTFTTRKTDPNHIVPLNLAHRVSLQSSLRTRQEVRAQTHASMQELEAQREDIERRMRILSQADQLKDVPAEEHEMLRQQVNHAFSDDRRWAEYILNGSTADAIVSEVADQSTVEDKADKAHKDVNQPMREILTSLTKYEEWTRHLEGLRDSLLPESEVNDQNESLSTTTTTHALDDSQPVKDTLKSASRASRVRFDRHQHLTMGNLSAQT
ncbi:hypothetical protein LTR10_023569 [Elasticomyces elasticus]|uniref:HAUS augmin-like complex subunit 6 N-terminal domain-containing protein n=1 Tax=Exophiala sideris TaxID=1016849 RepID=A0ABR0J643_9EURO|nr:hypothetical protein LTR10_023569 [Elasticomyces elasticus]KAK5028759.1 hypothetical protein LTS07_006138 [Exophiala sideris]KAK5035628.1 hypothetical protein LTR13_005757 [Exophiala sideris]KAK5057263.1 hypothetical protein LTR69_007302 [Exophiala sideris]KAK5181764.1 hypothetical protein LTR44_005964 [Eurotiomycetes sp. CCFEE 6388]